MQESLWFAYHDDMILILANLAIIEGGPVPEHCSIRIEELGLKAIQNTQARRQRLREFYAQQEKERLEQNISVEAFWTGDDDYWQIDDDDYWFYEFKAHRELWGFPRFLYNPQLMTGWMVNVNNEIGSIERAEKIRAEESGEHVGPYHRRGSALFWERGPMRWTSEERERHRYALEAIGLALERANLDTDKLKAEGMELMKGQKELQPEESAGLKTVEGLLRRYTTLFDQQREPKTVQAVCTARL